MSDALKGALAVVGLIVAAALIWVVATLVFGTAQSETADFRGGVAEREQTQGDGTYRIARYDEFFTICNRVITAEQEIDDASLPSALPTQVAETNRQAAVQSRRELVSTYNSRAQAAGTSGQFRDSGMPFQLETDYTPNGAKTRCAA